MYNHSVALSVVLVGNSVRFGSFFAVTHIAYGGYVLVLVL